MATIFMSRSASSIVAELSRVHPQPVVQWPEFGLHRVRCPQLAGSALPIAVVVPDTLPPYSVVRDVDVVAAGPAFS
ncbi:hypothetical protein H3V53_07370 [Paraburkholderia bengalensis]|uniref:Uncharacterized protein n=1 Tax=Paraburkholderia bengalensis TaxID=2747562 RepID=A0ABU8INN2_9BURK